MAQLHSFDDRTVNSVRVTGTMTASPTPARYDLDGISGHAGHILANAQDINRGLGRLLAHLRGETLCDGGCGEDKAVDGKLAAISVTQQATRYAQDETGRLIIELMDLLNVDA